MNELTKWQPHGFFADCPLAILHSQTQRYSLVHIQAGNGILLSISKQGT